MEAESMPRILLVEDNEMNRDMLSRRLIRKGYEVLLAVDGGQGVEMARTQAPDLLLMSEPDSVLSPTEQGELRHDLRTPFNHILGYAEMLLESAEEEGHEALI